MSRVSWLVTVAFVALCAGVVSARFSPDWDSLDSRENPGWYDDVKIGSFIHWGVFSVPSFGTENGGASGEWFWDKWRTEKVPAYVEFVNRTEAPGFTYAEYAPRFKAEFFNPDEWASLFSKSGIKYVVLTSKHHEGFTNWPSATSFNWNSVDTGPHRDIVGELSNAVRKAGLTMGLYFSEFEWYHPLYLQDKANNFSTDQYVVDVQQKQLREIVEAYKPAVIWSDGDWEAPDTYWKSTEFIAWLFNDSPVKDTVLVNDRWGIGTTCKHGSYLTCSDRYHPSGLQNRKWENAMTLDRYSWGFRRNMKLDDVLSVDELVSQVVSTVSCGGNILINVGPQSDGEIPLVFQERLLGLGQWLDVNGDAIYKTKPWHVAQNDTAAGQLWYTQSKASSDVYAISLEWPDNHVLTLTQPKVSASTEITLLGYKGGALSYTDKGGHIEVTLPTLNADEMPSQHAWVLKLTNLH